MVLAAFLRPWLTLGFRPARCNRENKHRGLCNNKCAIPGLSVYPPQELAQLDVNLEDLGVGSNDDFSSSDSEQGLPMA